MKFSKKLLNLIINNYLLILIGFFILFGCESEKMEPKYVAKVNESYLTETELKEALGSFYHNNKHREEFIRQWIEKEILYLQAVEKNVVNRNDYLYIRKHSNKELAGALLMSDFYSENEVVVTTSELEDFYENNRNDFKLSGDAVILNLIIFDVRDKAIDFRSELLKKNWYQAIKLFQTDKSIKNYYTSRLLYSYQIQPVKLLRAIDKLLSNEVSIVLETEPNEFIIVQLVENLNEFDIPKFDYIKSDVEERYKMINKKLLYKDFVEQLYSKYNVEIKQVN